LASWNTNKLINTGRMFFGAESMLRTFPNLKETPKTTNWEENFNRAKPTKGARH
jgi:hypothetical protein